MSKSVSDERLEEIADRSIPVTVGERASIAQELKLARKMLDPLKVREIAGGGAVDINPEFGWNLKAYKAFREEA